MNDAVSRYPGEGYPDGADASAVVSVYDRAGLVLDALESVTAQDFDGVVETIVVDDGSSDGSADAVARWAENHATALRPLALIRREHAGIAATVGAGIAAARGEYVAHLASDDMWREDRVRRALETIEAHGRPGAVYTNFSEIDIEKRPLVPDGMAKQGRTGIPAVISDGSGDVAPLWWAYRNVMGGALTFMPRAWLRGEREIPPGASEEDYWLSLVALLSGPVLYIDEPTYVVRSHPGQETRRRQLEDVRNEEGQLVLLDSQIALCTGIPGTERLIAILKVQRATVAAKAERDEGRALAAFGTLFKAIPSLVRWPRASTRWLARLFYCVSPAAYRALQRRRWE